MKKETKVANPETAKERVEMSVELTESQTLNAWFANHAVEHYCAALGGDVEEINATLQDIKKEDGVYWLYTQPAIDGKKSDGTPLPTAAEWEKLNEGAVRVDKLNGKQWYKRPFTLGDARGVRSLINGYDNYLNAKQGAKDRERAKIEAAAAVLGVSVETLLAMKK